MENHQFYSVLPLGFFLFSQGREKMEESKGPKKVMSACDVEALKKCLEENKGDYVKCRSQIEAFKSSCSLNKNPPSTTSMESQTKTA